MTEDEFNDITLRSLYYAIEGFNDLEEQRQTAHLSAVRWQTTVIYNMMLPKHKRIKPTDLLTLPSEAAALKSSKPVARKLTPEEEAELFGKYDLQKLEQWDKTG